jgi:hypothetical protein
MASTARQRSAPHKAGDKDRLSCTTLATVLLANTSVLLCMCGAHPCMVQLGNSSGAGLCHHTSCRSSMAQDSPGKWLRSSLAGRPTSPDVAQCSAIKLRQNADAKAAIEECVQFRWHVASCSHACLSLVHALQLNTEGLCAELRRLV